MNPILMELHQNISNTKTSVEATFLWHKSFFIIIIIIFFFFARS